MDIVILIIVFVIVGMILFGLPIIAAYTLWNKGRYTKYLVVAALLWYVFVWYRAFYPADSFYVKHLESFTGASFRDGAEVKEKYAGFPDIHGDYPACAFLKVSPASISQLISLPHGGYTEIDPNNVSSSCIDSNRTKFERVYYKESVGEIIYWGFNTKSNEVFFDYSSY